MEFVSPKVIRLAATSLDAPGVNAFLEAVGAGDWTTDAPSDGEELIEIAGRLCYLSFAPGLNANVEKVRKGNRPYIANLLKQLHLSVLEHVVVTYALKDVSRVLTAELGRHRHLCLSETSLRFVRLVELRAYLPEPFRDDPWAVERMTAFFEAAEQLQRDFADHFDLDRQPDFPTKKRITSAMRRCAPMGLTTSLIVTGNLRAWREVIQKRCTEHARRRSRR